jgi:hypothetical protein
MTIRTGNSYVVESFAQFRSRLDVSWTEVAQALDEDAQDDLLADANSQRADRGQARAESVTDLEDVEVMEWVEATGFGDHLLIQEVLDAREREYTHILDDVVHRIIELDPE